MCGGDGDLTADGLERGAAAGAAEVLKDEGRKNKKQSLGIVLEYLEQHCRRFFSIFRR